MLKVTNKIMKIKEWPNAVHEELICHTKKDYVQKARGILELIIDENLENSNFLDYSGVTNCISKEYGVICDKKQKFDIILLYDVIDYAVDPYKLIREIKEKLAGDGKLFIRCHPWDSRNADYSPTNKAYFHFFNRCNLYHNQVDYCQLFKDFHIEYKREFRNCLEPFFIKGIGNKIIMEKIGRLPEDIQYIDYKLKK